MTVEVFDRSRQLASVPVSDIFKSLGNPGVWIELTEGLLRTSKLVRVTRLQRFDNGFEFEALDQNRHTMKCVVVREERGGLTFTSARVEDWGDDAPLYVA